MNSNKFDGLNTTLIHQLKKKIDELSEEKERYTQLFEQSNDAIILVTLDGKVFGANNKTEELTEYQEKDIVGKHVFNLFPKEKLKENKKCFMKILKEGSCFIENKIITKSGEIKDVEINAKIIRLKEGTFVQAILRDITKKKRAERELKESEEKWSSLVKNAANIIIISDKNGKIQFINHTVSGLTIEKTIGTKLYDYIPKEYHSLVKKAQKEVFKTGKPNSYEIQRQGSDGSIAWYSSQIGPILKDRKVVAITTIVTDFTKQKKTEETLKESEEKFRAIFENAGEGIAIADAKTKKLIFVNSRMCKILGYKEKELLKLKVKDIHPKKDLPYVMKQFKKQLHKKMLTTNLPVLRKDKKVIFCDVTATPLMIKGNEYIAGFFLKT
jgi:PAS domain S-box-containing protein